MPPDCPCPPIFLNYRRRGTGVAHANTLRVGLERIFGKGTVFQDNAAIRSGEEWEPKIQKCIQQARVFLALIHGNEWFTEDERVGSFGNKERLLLRENDWVCKEIALALQQKDLLIIPVRLPSVNLWPGDDIKERLDAAPEKIATFFSKQVLAFDPDRLEASLEELEKRIRPVVPIPAILGPRPDQETPEPDMLASLPFDPVLIDGLCHLESPYVGSSHFEKRHAPLFFGREEDIRAIYEDEILSLSPGQVLLFYGASGAGKSSVLHAGLFPRLEYQGWHVGYHRRDKSIGLFASLEDLTGKALRSDDEQKLLLFDQIEEIFTDPLEASLEEDKLFFEGLKNTLVQHPGWKVVLGFRKEFLAEVKDRLKDRSINYRWYSLRPLSSEGVRKAIHGVFRNPLLKRQFENLESLDPSLEEALLADIMCDEASNIAPLLQFQLRTVWDKARDEAGGGPVHLAKVLYEGEKSLKDFLENHKMRVLEARFPEAARSGLLNDILHFYTTPDHTSADRLQAAFFDRYRHVEDRWPGVLSQIQQSLIDEYLLIFSHDKQTSRLTHDSLAKIVRERFDNSSSPGQQAFFIVHAKETAEKQRYEVDFSETDIAIIEEGQWGMPALSERLIGKMMADKENYIRQKTDRLNLALANSESNIEHLRFQEALKNLKLAASEKLPHYRIWELAWQLPFPLKQMEEKEALGEALAFLEGQKAPPNLEKDMWDRFFPVMVEVKGGEYDMGSEEGQANEKPVHQVRVSSFQMGVSPVTWWQFGLFCLLTGRDFPNDSGFGRGGRPAVNMKWFDAVDYCIWLTEWLSDLNGVKLEQVYSRNGNQVTADWTKNGFRLPTEAEWEYAAREGGRKVRFGNGMDIADPTRMNFDAEHEYNERYNDWYAKGKGVEATTPIMNYPPNAYGLYDMSGNVFDWCWDWYSEGPENFYWSSEGAFDPKGPESGDYRVLRGGAWDVSAHLCCCCSRYRDRPVNRNNYCGFRVSRRL